MPGPEKPEKVKERKPKMDHTQAVQINSEIKEAVEHFTNVTEELSESPHLQNWKHLGENLQISALMEKGSDLGLHDEDELQFVVRNPEGLEKTIEKLLKDD